MSLRAAAPRLSSSLLLAVLVSCPRTGALEEKPEISSARVRTRARSTMVELDRACTMGDGFSCWRLGQKYARGDDLPKDEQRAASRVVRQRRMNWKHPKPFVGPATWAFGPAAPTSECSTSEALESAATRDARPRSMSKAVSAGMRPVVTISRRCTRTDRGSLASSWLRRRRFTNEPAMAGLAPTVISLARCISAASASPGVPSAPRSCTKELAISEYTSLATPWVGCIGKGMAWRKIGRAAPS
jgi:hypothetical protein